MILALGSMYVVSYQNVSADEIVSHTIEINNDTANGPDLDDSDNFGTSVANIGDLNGDDTSDIAVGTPRDDTGGVGRGTIHVLFMNGNGSVSDIVEINSDTPNGPDLNDGDRFGSSIANIGDLNNDGVTDIAVGAHSDDAGDTADTKIGIIHIMFMNSGGTVSSTIEINNNTENGPDLNDGDRFGSSIANIGDLNGDGISDIAVGAYSDDAGGDDRGAIHIMLLNSDGTVSRTIGINSTTPNGPDLSNTDYFGVSIANIGDLNNDGVTDIAVGATGDDTGGSGRGAIHIMLLNSDGTVSSTIEINDDTPNGPDLSDSDFFGVSIANIGDRNGDGVTDIAVGANGDDTGGTDIFANIGAIHIMLLNSDGTVSSTIEINDDTPNGPVLNNTDGFGRSIANIGDRNGDGISDIAVGANQDDADSIFSNANTGAIHIMLLNNNIFAPNITDITSDGTTDTLKVGDTITFTLTLESAEYGVAINGTYNSIPLLWNSTNNGTTYTATYTVSEGQADQATPLQITNVTVITRGFTSLPFNGTDIQSTIDANSPKFTHAETISTSQIEIVLDQNVTNNTASFNDFTLGGVDGGSIGSIAYATDNVIRLNIVSATILDTDSVTLSYNRISGSFDEASGNSLLNFAEDVTNTLDTTPPVITLTGTNLQIIELGSGYTELGATTNDGSSVTIDATGFTDEIGTYSIYYDSADTAGNNAIQVIRTVEVIPPPASCTPPASGDWTISESCMINSDATIQGNVLVRDGSVLSIPSGVVLDIDFVSFSLTVQSGSGVLIKSGGTVT